MIELLFIQSLWAACPEHETKAKVCWALCRHEGYDTGSYEDKGDACVCGVRKDFKDFTLPPLTIPALPPRAMPKAYKKESDY